MMVLILSGPAWAVGCIAQYNQFDNSLVVYPLDGKPVLCDAQLFRYE